MKTILLFNTFFTLYGYVFNVTDDRIAYANVGHDAILSCRVIPTALTYRWRRNDKVLSNGLEINKENKGWQRYKTSRDSKEFYRLLISNVTYRDAGYYWCGRQIRQGIDQLGYELRIIGYTPTVTAIITTEKTITSYVDKSTGNFTTVNSTMTSKTIDDISTKNMEITDGNDNGDDSGGGNNGSGGDKNGDGGDDVKEDGGDDVKDADGSGDVKEGDSGDKNGDGGGDDDSDESKTIGLSTKEIFYYSLLAAGLAIVLFLSIGCNLCINRKCKTVDLKRGNIENKENILDVNIEQRNGNEAEGIEVVEDSSSYFSHYETIDESKMIRLPLATPDEISNMNRPIKTNVTDRVMNNLLSHVDETYLDVVPDDEDVSREHKVDLEHVHPDFDISRHNSKKDVVLQNFQIPGIKRNSLSTNSTSSYSSAIEKSDLILKRDDYLNPYVPLNTNNMEYLSSYSTPLIVDFCEQRTVLDPLKSYNWESLPCLTFWQNNDKSDINAIRVWKRNSVNDTSHDKITNTI